MMQENLIRMYQQSFRDNAELPALSDYFKQETFSYMEMAQEIAKIHLLFETCGIERGDKIALIGRNNPRWVIAYIATITYGAVIVPMLQDFPANDVNHIIQHSESKLLFLGDNFWDIIHEDELERIQAAFSLTDFHCLYEQQGDRITRFQEQIDTHFRTRYPEGFTKEEIRYPEITNDTLCLLNYTSGTTGFSKGVMLPVNSLTANVVFVGQHHIHARGSRVLSFLPLAHAYGCAFDFLTSFCAGSHTTYLGKIPSPKVLLKAFAEVKPSCIFTVPLIIEKIYRKQIMPMLEKRSMRWALSVPLIDSAILAAVRNKLTEAFGGEFSQVIIGGAPMNPDAEAFFKKIGFRFTDGYGMTECAPLISYTPWNEYKLTSVGRVLPAMEARIEKRNADDEVGEILVRGEHVMMGYYKNEEATRAVLDDDGWLHTGDMGMMDDDGTLYIRGRNKTMLLGPSGQNIYPEEIEAKLNNMPFVMESLVLENSDHKLVGFVVPDYDAVDEAKLSHKELEMVMEENRKNLNAMTASYENLVAIQLYPKEFEKTPKKSIKRFLYVNLLK